MMIFMNAAYKAGKCPKEYAEGFIKMFYCICPHVGEELWHILGHQETIAYEKWPIYDEEAIREDFVTIAVQVNGKVKGTMEVALEEENDSVIEKAKEIAPVKAAISEKAILKEIYVKGRIVNIVVK